MSLPGHPNSMQSFGGQARIFDPKSKPLLSLATAPSSQGTLDVGDCPGEHALYWVPCEAQTIQTASAQPTLVIPRYAKSAGFPWCCFSDMVRLIFKRSSWLHIVELTSIQQPGPIMKQTLRRQTIATVCLMVFQSFEICEYTF